MAKAKTRKAGAPRPVASETEVAGFEKIGVEGFKSIRKETEIAIRPLTILAGTNSSGKSSIMQPMLLMKQTLEAPYDPPGALLLDGPHVRFTAAEQIVSRFGKQASDIFVVTLHMLSGRTLSVCYDTIHRTGGLGVRSMSEANESGVGQTLRLAESHKTKDGSLIIALPKRGLLVEKKIEHGQSPTEASEVLAPLAVRQAIDGLGAMIHVPAMRGNPERTYQRGGVGPTFSGVFNPYVASIIHHWQVYRDIRLKQLGVYLQKLGLNWKVEASRIDDTRIELRVGRRKQKTTGGNRDLVSIADVGFGVSQCLPVLVALLTARSGQLVYIEEPEIHLHPRAQVALAQVLADAANRGVRVVVETHSSLLITGVQTLLAEGALAPDRVVLHWFSLDDDGATEVQSADLDEAGAFGDWPEDFAAVTLDAQARYLDAAEKRLRKAKR